MNNEKQACEDATLWAHTTNQCCIATWVAAATCHQTCYSCSLASMRLPFPLQLQCKGSISHLAPLISFDKQCKCTCCVVRQDQEPGSLRALLSRCIINGMSSRKQGTFHKPLPDHGTWLAAWAHCLCYRSTHLGIARSTIPSNLWTLHKNLWLIVMWPQHAQCGHHLTNTPWLLHSCSIGSSFAA